MKNCRKKNQRGFTLTEVLTVLGITIIITLITYDIFLVSQQSFKKGDAALEITQNGRIFLDRLTRELRQTPEIATSLPPAKTTQGFPPAAEIMFADGHDVPDIQYLRYFLNNGMVKRQRLVYYFATEPGVYVHWNARDAFGQLPQSSVLEERDIAEYVNQIKFYGAGVTYMEIWLTKGLSTAHFYTGVWGRNTRL
ncbi:MAG: prepilin-type N-terminal cleavage/methylation domain-containing protein [Candidatus Komeilibacteria bacterium]|nr:prepilin-type N-terminal cleavage/methylation domain-containing protein [Candidatus Komeilibacteria bacterium]